MHTYYGMDGLWIEGLDKLLERMNSLQRYWWVLSFIWYVLPMISNGT